MDEDRVEIIACWMIPLSLVILLLVPLLIVELPPILDYPIHLARMKILSEGSANTVLSQMYEVHWGLIPNIAIDLLTPWLLRFVPLFTAGKLMLAVMVLLPVLGVALFSRALFGRWSLWSLGSGLAAYNGITLLGFMNFQIGLALALIVAAGWIACRDRAPVPTVIGGAVGAVLLFFLHIFSVLFLGILLGCHELMRIHQRRRAGLKLASVLWRSTVAIGCVFAVPVLLYGMSALSDNGADMGWRDLGYKATGLFLPFLNYSPGLDIATGLAIAAFVLFCWWKGWFSVPLSTIVAMVVLGIAYLAAPFSFKGASFVDLRMTAMMGFLLFAGTAPARMPRPIALMAILAVSGLFLVRMTVLSLVWIGSQQDVADVRRAIAPVEPGSKVLLAACNWEDNKAYWLTQMPPSRRITRISSTFIHLAALLTIEHDSFWPLLFAEPAKQPLRARPPYDELSIPEGWPPSYRLLDKEDPKEVWDPKDLAEAPYLSGWDRHFDYVLILNVGGIADLRRIAPTKMDLVNANGMAALYRVRPPHQSS
jgi:hypothetical protein